MARNNRKAQIRKIWAEARRLGWDSGMLHHCVEAWTHKKSIAELNKRERMLVIDLLVKIRREAEGIPISDVSDAQIWKIWNLAGQLGWNIQRLAGFLEKQVGVSLPEMIPSCRAARGVIEALKAMLKRREKHERSL